MGNYKPHRSSINNPNANFGVPDTVNFKFLTKAITGTYILSMEDVETGADYVVPTGKTFHPVSQMINNSASAQRNYSTYSHNVADTTGGTLKFQILYLSIALQYTYFPLNPNQTFPAGDYVNISNAIGAETGLIYMIGYET